MVNDYKKINFSSPIEVSPAEGHRTRGEKIAEVSVNGQRLTSIPPLNLRQAITDAALKEGMIVRSFGTFPEIPKGIGVRVELTM